MFRQRCLSPCPPVPADITMVLCYLLQSCLLEGLPDLPQQWHLKGVLETSSGQKCIALPVLSLQWQWGGWEHGEQALNVSTLFLVRFVSCRISSAWQLPVGKYFCEFLEVPPPPTGKGLWLERQQQSCPQPHWGSSETIWCLRTWRVTRGLCPKGKLPVLGEFSWRVSGCSEDKAQFYSLVASAQGRGGGVSMTYLVKCTVPRMKGAADSAGS